MDFKSLIGYKDFSTLVTEAFNRLKTAGSLITNLTVGGPFRTLVELCMQGISDLHTLLLAVVPQGFAEHATGKWLDMKCKDIDLVRKAATKTAGVVTFSRQVSGPAVTIPSGTVVKTDPMTDGEPLRFVTTQTVVLPAGNLSASVPVQAEFPGAKYNVADGAIKYMVTFVAGIDSVTNAAGWRTSEGADDETDDALRQRYVLKWSELSFGGTKQAYASWALQVAGVVDVAVVAPSARAQGAVDVIIMGTAGAPTQALIDSVTSYIDAHRPTVANVLVKGPTLVNVDVDVTLTLPADQGDTTTVQAEAEKRIRALFMKDATTTVEPLKIGDDVYRSRLVSILMGIPPVVNVTVTSPAADIVVAATDRAALGVLTVTVGRLAA